MSDLDFSGIRALVADDQPFVRHTIVRFLTKLGVKEVLEAEDGVQTLSAIEESDGPIDIIFCDLQMPGRDGIEILRDLSELNSAMAVVIISGEDVEVLQAAVKLADEQGLNVLGSLEKPATAEKVGDFMQQLVKAPEKKFYRPSATVDENDLKAAVEDAQIIPYFQPKVSMDTREMVSVEALARWMHPEHGMISPGVFIPLAEQHDLIDAVTNTMLQQAVAQCVEWEAEGLSIQLAINLSVNSLEQLDLPEHLVSLIEAAGFTPEQIVLEVTESRISDNPTALLDIATRLRLKRFSLSIDDFGTGFSSLQQLQRLPFTELKVDQAFVTGAAEDKTARSILESSIDLAQKLGMKIVVEGIETQADWDLVASLGCDLAQGYFIARPMAGEDVIAWHAEWQQQIG